MIQAGTIGGRMATTRQRWTQLERRLWFAVRRGDEVDVRSEGNDPPHIWGPTRTVRAEVIRELLLTSPSPLPGRIPSLQLSGARITGALELEHARIDIPFNFEECWFDERINLYAARTRTIYLRGCRTPGMYAEEMRTDGELNLEGLRCTARLDLDNAHISGLLTLSGAQLSNPDGVALSADGAEFGSDVLCNAHFRAQGEIRMAGVHVKGDLDLTSATLTNPGGDSLWADSAQISGDVMAMGGFHAVGRTYLSAATIGRGLLVSTATFDNPDGRALQCSGIRVTGPLSAVASTVIGEFSLVAASIDGPMGLRDAVLSNPGGDAFSGEGLHAAGGVFCIGLQVTGGFWLSSAHIAKGLDFSAAALSNPGRTAFGAVRTVVDGNAHFDNGFSARGEVRLQDAHIRGQLNLVDATIGNAGATALYADGLVVDTDFLAIDCSFDGELRIISARVATDMVLTGTALVNDGNTLTAEGLTVGRNVNCGSGFSCTGEMSLSGSSIGHQLVLRGATLRHADNYALRASHLTVGEDIFADDDFTVHGRIDLSPCRVAGTIALATENIDGTVDLSQSRADVLQLEGKPRGRVVLTDATVRVLEHHPEDWPEAGGLDLQGLTYTSLQPLDLPVGRWLKWLRCGLPDGYRPQPYAQLATMLRTVGNDRDSRVVLLARQRHRRKHLPLWSKPWGWLQDIAVGYGYVPWRAAGWLGVLWLAGWLYFRTQQPLPQPPGSTTDYQPALYALDLLLPVLSIGQRSAVHFAGPAQAIAVLITVCSWILGITVLAGLTRALTRN
jgi:hypothetical protein